MQKIIHTHILESKLLVEYILNQKSRMHLTADKDAEFGDAHFDVCRNEKRLIRATVKTYEKTGTYVFLKLFKKAENELEFQQRLTLTLAEFEKMTKNIQKFDRLPPTKNQTIQQVTQPLQRNLD